MIVLFPGISLLVTAMRVSNHQAVTMPVLSKQLDRNRFLPIVRGKSHRRIR